MKRLLIGVVSITILTGFSACSKMEENAGKPSQTNELKNL